jgi:hypothetical protein
MYNRQDQRLSVRITNRWAVRITDRWAVRITNRWAERTLFNDAESISEYELCNFD